MEDNETFIGVVEDNNDPKRRGRIKVRIECMHGRKDDKNSISTEKLPWVDASRRDKAFGVPNIGKVIYVTYLNGDYYKPVWENCEHYNINLQDKLESLGDKNYREFTALHYDDIHQYYTDLDEGLVLDYNKSRINLKPNGDISMNLRDNSSKLYLGSPDANQQAILGNHFIKWMDKFLNVLLTTPYLGNLAAPVLPSPDIIQIINEFKAIKETFLSDHVFIVDDSNVKEQNRDFDIAQVSDNYNDENMDKVNNIKTKGYQPETRGKVGNSPEGVPPNDFSDNLTSSMSDPTTDKSGKFDSPLGEYENGEIPLEGLTISKYLNNSFSDENDERKYLIDEAATNLDAWLDKYFSEKKDNWFDIIVTKGYQDIERQTNIHNTYKSSSPKAGKDPFGYANQIELYLGIVRNSETEDAVKDYLRTMNIPQNPLPEVEMLKYLIESGKKFRWSLAGNTSNGDVQWWHWIFK